MPGTVRVIAPTITSTGRLLNQLDKHKRVAAYARVSTDDPEQLTSYETQKAYYEKYISSHEGWELVGIYADEGISGTQMKNRAQFNEMLDLARKGHIDMIITKSMSRFARNTVDTLKVIEEMRKRDVEIFFEKENISTSDRKIDFLLTIIASLAQEESRSISQNVTLGVQKRMELGTFRGGPKRFYGYKRNEYGVYEIVESEAQVIRRIFAMCMSGLSLNDIAEILNKEGIPSRNGGEWLRGGIRSILRNEKYKGCTLYQKTYTTDFLTHKIKINQGQRAKYFIENSHEAIVEPKLFDGAQVMLKSQEAKYKYPLAGKVICGNCFKTMNRLTTYRKNGDPVVVLTCRTTAKSSGKCSQKWMRYDDVEEITKRLIAKLYNHEKANELTLTVINKAVENSLSLMDEISAARKEMKANEERMQDLLINRDNLQRKGLTSDELEKRFEELKTSIRNSQLLIESYERDMVANGKITRNQESLRNLVEKGSQELNRVLVDKLFDRIIEKDEKSLIYIKSNKPMSLEVLRHNLSLIDKYKPKIEGEYKGTSYRYVEVNHE